MRGTAAIATLERRLAALEALVTEPPPPLATDLLAGQVAPSMRAIARAVCAEWGVTLAELLSPRRDAGLVEARHAAWYLARHLNQASLPAIGRTFRRDHTTVLTGIRRFAERLAGDAHLAARVARAAAISTHPPSQEA